jgi:hypothetical protein
MFKKMIIRGAFLGAIALAAVSCFSGLDGQSKYDGHARLAFEPANPYEWESFVNQFFNEGKDTVAAYPYFTTGSISVCAKLSDDDVFQGGFALCRGVDTLAAADRKPSYFAVFDKGGNQGSYGYVVFHDTTATLMPEHAVLVPVPNEQSSNAPTLVFVQNVQATVQAARLGTGLAGGPFGAGDHLTLTVTGYKGTAKTGEKSVALISGTEPLKEWTDVDLSGLGSVDALDFHLSSNRDDMPLYCCVDDLVIHVTEIY